MLFKSITRLLYCHTGIHAKYVWKPNQDCEIAMQESTTQPLRPAKRDSQTGAAHAPPGAGLLFLREEELRVAQDLIFFAMRDLNAAPDDILAELGYGRAHHRTLHWIGRRPGLKVGELLAILGITKQSLTRVLGPLIREGYVAQVPGQNDRRQRLLSLTENRCCAGAQTVRGAARAAAGGVSRGRRAGGGRIPPRAARHDLAARAATISTRWRRHAPPKGRARASDAE